MMERYSLVMPKSVHAGSGAMEKVTEILQKESAKKIALFTDKSITALGLTEPVEATTLHVQDEILIYGQPEIQQWHDYWFGVDARPLLYADTPQLAETLPACGKRWSIIPAGATEPYLRMFSNVQVLRLAHPPAERTFYLVTPKGRALSAAAETLLEDLRVQIQDLEGITWY